MPDETEDEVALVRRVEMMQAATQTCSEVITCSERPDSSTWGAELLHNTISHT